MVIRKDWQLIVSALNSDNFIIKRKQFDYKGIEDTLLHEVQKSILINTEQCFLQTNQVILTLLF